MPRPQQAQSPSDASRTVLGEEEVVNGGPEGDEAMEEDIEPEGYGAQCSAEMSSLILCLTSFVDFL